jgi:hypothetical protein
MGKLFSRDYKTVLGLLLLGWLAGSCKKLIEIPSNPPTEISTAEQFSDSASTMSALAGVYSYSAGSATGFMFDDGLLSVSTGSTSDEVFYTNTGDPVGQQFYGNGLLSSNYQVASLWANPYTGIYPLNAILAGITGNTALSAPFIQQVTGEMKVLRALYYFDLVNLFGGVPLVTSLDYKTTANLPRSSVDSVYSFIMTDLTDAQKDLTAAYPSPGAYRPNLYAATALLAKVYLYRGQWQNAYDAANSVIGSGLYSLVPNLNGVFLDGSTEAIWQVPATGSYEVTQEAQEFVPNYTGVPEYPLTTNMVNAFETGDQRLQDWVGQLVVNTGSGNQTFYYAFKYKNVLASSPTTEDFMILRLADTYLVRAEAAAQLGNTGSALADLNVIRARAGLPASTAVSQADVLSAIMHERRIELFTEWGNRWFDLKRTGTIDAVLGAEKPGWKGTDSLYPIPLKQISANSFLVQNPGYN